MPRIPDAHVEAHDAPQHLSYAPDARQAIGVHAGAAMTVV
jgi:hypothetical protein